MGIKRKITISEQMFEKNVDFWNTPLIDARKELFKKRMQLSLIEENSQYSTEDLKVYMSKLEEYIKVNSIDEDKIKKEEEIKIDYKESVQICNTILIFSVLMVLIFGTFSIMSGRVILIVITLINSSVVAFIMFYKNYKTKNIQNINNNGKEIKL